MQIQIAVLIPVYNRLELTRHGLGVLDRQLTEFNRLRSGSGIVFRPVVIDDGSTDGTGEFLKREYPHFVLLETKGNQWWTGSISFGAKYSLEVMNADYILLWNDDVEAREDYFLSLAKIILTGRCLDSILGSMVYYKSDPNKIWSAGGAFNRFSGSYENKTHINSNNQSEFVHADWLPGMGTILSAKTLTDSLWWNVRSYPQYHGDSDLILRAKRKGVNILVSTKLVMYNNIDSSGIVKQRSFKYLLPGLTSLRSSMNLKKNLMFYWEHGFFPIAYLGLAKKYLKYFGSFFKFTLNQLVKRK